MLRGGRSHSWGDGHPISSGGTTDQFQEIQGIGSAKTMQE